MKAEVEYLLREAKVTCVVGIWAGVGLAIAGATAWNHTFVIGGGVLTVVGATFYGMLTRAEEEKDVR